MATAVAAAVNGGRMDAEGIDLDGVAAGAKGVILGGGGTGTMGAAAAGVPPRAKMSVPLMSLMRAPSLMAVESPPPMVPGFLVDGEEM